METKLTMQELMAIIGEMYVERVMQSRSLMQSRKEVIGLTRERVNLKQRLGEDPSDPVLAIDAPAETDGDSQPTEKTAD